MMAPSSRNNHGYQDYGYQDITLPRITCRLLSLASRALLTWNALTQYKRAIQSRLEGAQAARSKRMSASTLAVWRAAAADARWRCSVMQGLHVARMRKMLQVGWQGGRPVPIHTFSGHTTETPWDHGEGSQCAGYLGALRDDRFALRPPTPRSPDLGHYAPDYDTCDHGFNARHSSGVAHRGGSATEAGRGQGPCGRPLSPQPADFGPRTLACASPAAWNAGRVGKGAAGDNGGAIACRRASSAMAHIALLWELLISNPMTLLLSTLPKC